MRVYIGIVIIDGHEQFSTAIFEGPDDDYMGRNMCTSDVRKQF
jgi:hypothetical protein